VRGRKFGDRHGAVAHHRDGELAAGHELLDQDLLAKRGFRHLDGGEVVAFTHDMHAYAGALIDRLYHIWARHGIAGCKRVTFDHLALGRHAGRAR